MKRLSTFSLFWPLFGLFAVLLGGCDKGLEPPLEGDVILRGRVDFAGGVDSWPERDSIYDLRVAAFQEYPPESLVGDIVEQRAWFTDDSLATFQESVDWEITIPSPGPARIAYLVVAMQNGPNIFEDWIAVGVHAPADQRDQPTVIQLQPGAIIEDIVLTVDFDDLPPQPF